MSEFSEDNIDEHLSIVEKRLELVEYKIKERIEEKIWNKITRWGAIAGVGLTLITVVGFPALISSIGSKAVSEVKSEIDNETKLLADKLSADLAALAVTKATLQEEANRSKEILNESEGYSLQLIELNKRFEELSRDAAQLRIQAESAMLAARVASQNTKSLRDTISDSAAGEPAILSWNVNPGSSSSLSYSGPISGYVRGSNFGEEVGKIYVIIAIYHESDYDEGISHSDMVGSDPISIQSESIKTWTNEYIDISFSDLDVENILRALDKLGRQQGFIVSLSYVVESREGGQSRIPTYGSGE